MSQHESNTIKRSGQGARLSEGGRGEQRRGSRRAGEGSGDTAGQTDTWIRAEIGSHTVILLKCTPQHTMWRQSFNITLQKNEPTKL